MLLHRLPLWVWFVFGALSVAAVLTIHLGWHHWNPTAYLQVGATTPARIPIERDFPELALESSLGHDGKYSYLLARQPAFWRADDLTLTGLQDPGYRYARPLYPLLGGLGGQLSPWGTLVGLLVVQLFAGGLYSVALARFARWHRLPSAFVLLNLANPGISSSACLLTSDLLAIALALTAWQLVERGRLRYGIALFALALLAKEYYVLLPLALAAAFAGQRRWRDALAIAGLPLVPILAWKLALTAAVGLGQGQSNFDRPFAGILQTYSEWPVENIPFGLFGLVIVLGTLDAVMLRRLPARLRWACLVWGLLGACTSRLVWADPHDLLRAIAPAWWLTSWAGFAASRSRWQPAEPVARALGSTGDRL